MSMASVQIVNYDRAEGELSSQPLVTLEKFVNYEMVKEMLEDFSVSEEKLKEMQVLSAEKAEIFVGIEEQRKVLENDQISKICEDIRFHITTS